ncbi:hypothetical protein K1719_026551 [Acacia pycnantha]|nr:hypothetical protein K1719_026551 [Acacia pycnantha]
MVRGGDKCSEPLRLTYERTNKVFDRNENVLALTNKEQSGGGPLTRVILILMWTHLPKGLMTLCEFNSQFRKLGTLGYDDFVFIPSVGRSGGLVAVWMNDQIEVTALRLERHFVHIHCSVRGLASFLITAIYVIPSSMRKTELWRELMNLANNISELWVIAGDFNDISSLIEKTRGSTLNQSRLRLFQDRVQACNLSDLGFICPRYT